MSLSRLWCGDKFYARVLFQERELVKVPEDAGLEVDVVEAGLIQRILE